MVLKEQRISEFLQQLSPNNLRMQISNSQIQAHKASLGHTVDNTLDAKLTRVDPLSIEEYKVLKDSASSYRIGPDEKQTIPSKIIRGTLNDNYEFKALNESQMEDLKLYQINHELLANIDAAVLRVDKKAGESSVFIQRSRLNTDGQTLTDISEMGFHKDGEAEEYRNSFRGTPVVAANPDTGRIDINKVAEATISSKSAIINAVSAPTFNRLSNEFNQGVAHNLVSKAKSQVEVESVADVDIDAPAATTARRNKM